MSHHAIYPYFRRLAGSFLRVFQVYCVCTAICRHDRHFQPYDDPYAGRADSRKFHDSWCSRDAEVNAGCIPVNKAVRKMIGFRIQKTPFRMRTLNGVFVMAEKEGFEPSHACTSAGFRNQSLQPLGYFSVCLLIIS